MPFRVFGKCVHKVNEDGSQGALEKCHETEAAARAHMTALNINVREGKVQTTYFAELIDLTEAILDEENKTVRVTLIAPGWSKNGRHYPKQVLEQAAPLFEGIKAYADHPTKSESKERPERSIHALVGWYENVKAESDGRLTADLKIRGQAEEKIWPLITTAVKEKPDWIGTSINALGKVRKGEAEGRKGIMVESIVKANSTDIVTTPAAGGRFESLLMGGDSFTQDLLDSLELDEIREARPDLIEALKKEWKTPRDSKALESAQNEKAELTEKLEAVEKKLAKARKAARTEKRKLNKQLSDTKGLLWEAQVDMVLASAKRLPKEWRQGVRARLLKVEDIAEAQGILDEEMEKLSAVRGKVPVRGSGRNISPQSKAKPETNIVAGVMGVAETVSVEESYTDFARRKADTKRQ